MKKTKRMRIEKYSKRYWAVFDCDDNLICVTVYKKGAKEVLRRLEAKVAKDKP